MDEQFLRDEITKVQGYKTKANHEKIVREDMNQRYIILSQIRKDLQEQIIIEQYQIQNEKENLQLQLIHKRRNHGQKCGELDFINFEKNQILKRCDRNQHKWQALKEANLILEKASLQLQKQKTKVLRQTRQNQILNERACLENERLRKKCQQMIISASSQQLQNQDPSVLKLVKKIIEQNAKILKNIIQVTEKAQKQQQVIQKFDNSSLKQRVIELKKQLQIQRATNLFIGNSVKCEQMRYFQTSSKVNFLEKDSQTRQALLQKAYDEEYQLTQNIQKQGQKLQQLKMKYEQYMLWRTQLQQTYGKLSSNYNTFQHSDMKSVRQIGKVSSRFEKNLQHQRHFLMERYNIVDSYRKYLSQNPPL